MVEKSLCEPLVFGHVYFSAPWGGQWLRALYARTDAPEVCSESWELSAHPFGMSIVRDGPLAGLSLAELAQRYGSALTGKNAPDPYRFPLLLKLLDVRRSLSVQVHPNERNAACTNGEPKTEAWIVLAAAPGAALYAGVASGVNEEAFRTAVTQGESFVGTLSRHAVRQGDALYVPGGVVHAVGAGCLLFEVQQSSNTTYRLYDWDRTDAYGKVRALHIDEALKSIDFAFPPVRVHRAREDVHEGANVWCTYLRTHKFVVRGLLLADRVQVLMDGSTFLSVFVLDGSVKVTTSGGARHVVRGSSVLVPACASDCRLEADIANTRLLITTL